MEWEANHIDGFIISPQNDLPYFFDSMTQEIYQELLWAEKKNTGTLCVYVHYKCIYILEK